MTDRDENPPVSMIPDYPFRGRTQHGANLAATRASAAATYWKRVAQEAEARVRKLEAAARAVVEAARGGRFDWHDKGEAYLEMPAAPTEALACLLGADPNYYEPVRPDIHRQAIHRAEAAEARVRELEKAIADHQAAILVIGEDPDPLCWDQQLWAVLGEEAGHG
jgi:hypothetical protein